MVENSKEIFQPNQEIVLERLINACQQDDRIIASFLGGSYAQGTYDAFSDLDIFLITSDADYDEFCANRFGFMRHLGEPISMENFEVPNIVCFVLDNGVEGDLVINRENQVATILTGPYHVLLDKRAILQAAVFTEYHPEPTEQTEKLRRLIYWFWHDYMHFTTALGRGQLWWAQGQLEALRGYCVSLLRMRNDFNDHEAGGEHYFKIEKAVPVEQLSKLKSSFGPVEKNHLRTAGLLIAEVYKGLAPDLAQEHGIPYPKTLEMLMQKRLEEIVL